MMDKSAFRLECSREVSNSSQVHSDTVAAIFSRYRQVLHSVAYGVLFNHREADNAVRNLFLSVSDNMPRFECEGSFRSWLLRALIDEALDILHKNRTRLLTYAKPTLNPPHLLPPPNVDLRRGSGSLLRQGFRPSRRECAG
jgi:DNA-directed RNA polymerase specialized sigma24 family protein